MEEEKVVKDVLEKRKRTKFTRIKDQILQRVKNTLKILIAHIENQKSTSVENK